MFSYLGGALSAIRWQDVVDIILITFVLYRLYLWIQGTRALRILIALAALGLLYLLARWSGLFITTWILQYLWAVILVIAVVIFQSEIRQVLERMSPLRFFLGHPEALNPLVLEEVVRAAFELAQKRIGALIVFQRRDILEDHLKGGIPLDGRVSYEVLSSIFLPNSPAHDGAVIIHEGRITSLGCYLPLSDNPGLPRNYGTRHRAGIGITERCDAISLIVSEQRGEVLLAMQGEISRMILPEELKGRLESMLLKPERTKGRWQAVLTANLVPKSVSLILVLMLWGFLVGQERAELRVTIPLEYRNVPPNMEIVGEGADKIEVGIRGSRGIIFGITPEKVRAYVDLSQAQPGQNYLRLTTENIRIPWGTEITKVNPATVRLTLEPIEIRSVPVKVHLVGTLPSSLRLKSFSVDPPFILLQGPESALAKVRAVFTEPVDLSAIKECKRISVGVEVTPPQLRLAPDQSPHVILNVRVERAT